MYQLCHQMALNCARQGFTVAYLDSSLTFSVERLAQMDLQRFKNGGSSRDNHC